MPKVIQLTPNSAATSVHLNPVMKGTLIVPYLNQTEVFQL